ncbi:AbrB family transcriptional regulator [Paenibacillus sp. YYML68]|uniref:AbrB family transcriptional regulator n=1 Tax=Paenibacillus sp. YYML68 TaxID=2909250 RepID=UPI002492A76E|nr:AbrB family transcriptional regulator [Paenibacillus sp. YYML68]
MKNQATRLLPFVETVAVSSLGGWLFQLLNAPLAWMLGPLTAAVLWQTGTGRRLVWPSALRNAGLLLLGYGLGLSFTLDSARSIAAQLPSMLAATVLTVGFSLLTALVLSRAAGISPESSIIGSIPGGLTQMVVLGEEIPGADHTVVTFMQTIRLLTVIFIVPFLTVHGLNGGITVGLPVLVEPESVMSVVSSMPVHEVGASAGVGSVGGAGAHAGAGAGVGAVAHAVAGAAKLVLCAALTVAAASVAARLKLPTPWFLGPIVLAALLTVFGWGPPVPPEPLVLAAQWSLGIYLGIGIRFSSLASWGRLLPYSLASSLALVAFALGLSYLFTLVHPVSLTSGFLSVAPGGMTEMGVVAAVVGADVSLVVAYQMFRILFILFIVPYALRRLFQSSLLRKREAEEKANSMR